MSDENKKLVIIEVAEGMLEFLPDGSWTLLDAYDVREPEYRAKVLELRELTKDYTAKRQKLQKELDNLRG